MKKKVKSYKINAQGYTGLLDVKNMNKIFEFLNLVKVYNKIRFAT